MSVGEQAREHQKRVTDESMGGVGVALAMWGRHWRCGSSTSSGRAAVAVADAVSVLG